LKGIPPLPDSPELRVWIKLDTGLASVEEEIETLKGAAATHLGELNELEIQVRMLKGDLAEREVSREWPPTRSR
jgi:hypothetical protein